MRCLFRFVSVAALAATAIANSYSRRWSARARTPIGRSYIASSRLLNAVRTCGAQWRTSQSGGV